MRLVNRASPFEVTLSFASIHTSPMNASFEEARAACKGYFSGVLLTWHKKKWQRALEEIRSNRIKVLIAFRAKSIIGKKS